MNKRDLTRQIIIEKSAPVFSRKGYLGTSMRDLTEAIGLTKGAIYGNFRDKDELALAAFDYHARIFKDALGRVMEEQKNAIDKLLSFSGVLRKFFFINQDKGGCPIVNTAVDSSHVHSELNRKVTRLLENWCGFFSRIINQGKEEGSIHQNIDTELYASVLLTLIEGSVMLSSSTSDMRFFDHSFFYLETMIRNDLMKR